MKDAVVAAEDRKFWTHKGVDPEGLVRAAVTNYREGEVKQGGSTITQQYVKNTYLTGERSVSRKLNEAVLATRLERDLADQLGSRKAAKEEILFRYLNTTYFGSGAYGAEAAAQSYFRKDLKDVNISEAATLAAIIPAPSKYGPRDDLFLAEARRVQVLDEMHTQGMISDAQYDDAKAKFLWPSGFGDPGGPTTAFYPPPENGAAQYPYFVDYVRSYLTKKYGDKYGEDFVFTSGLKIETTVDPRMQQAADEVVTKTVGKSEPTVAMSLVSVDPSTGFVKAMVGGRDFAQNQVNLALGGTYGLQPGSSMKPYTMATALEQGITPDTVFPATTAWPVPGNCIKSKGNSCVIQGEAASTMAPAIAESSNTYFAQLAYAVGPNNIAKMANRLGVSRIDPTKKDYNVTLTLGTSGVSPLDQAVGYATFENHGVRNDPTPVVKVTLPDGTVLEDNTQRTGTQVLNPAIADTVTDLLRGPVVSGTASASLAGFGRPAAGKTGTTEFNDNAWFVGFTPQLSTAVWLGHLDGDRPLTGFGSGRVFGGTVPAQTWKAFMRTALDGQPVLDFPKPGPLPVGGALDPGGQIDPNTRRANVMAVPEIRSDCGGPCLIGPSLTTPTTAPPTTAPPVTTVPTTPPTTAGTTTTTKKGKSP
jgi:membrane peptidoglycan carboxypeptidase